VRRPGSLVRLGRLARRLRDRDDGHGRDRAHRRLVGLPGLAKLGYEHRPRSQRAEPGEQLLPRAHRAVSNLKAWLHGTHRWASPEHLPAYLDEFVFRHNRRGTPHAAFQTLLGLSARHEPAAYGQIIDHAA
jgi:hypothetical protein